MNTLLFYSIYPTPVSYSELKNYLKLADNTTGFETLLTEFLEAATERVYTFCNWDFTRKLTAHPDPTNATYDEYNNRWVRFLGDGKAKKRLSFSVGLVRQMSRTNPYDVTDNESFQTGSNAGMHVPIAIVVGQHRNIIYLQDGEVFRDGHEYELECIYQLEGEEYQIPESVRHAITIYAAKMFNESGWGNGELGHAEASNMFAAKVKLMDLDEQVKAMLHPHRVLSV